MKFSTYDSNRRILTRTVRGRSVLHLGAVGETRGDGEKCVAEPERSARAYLTEAASRCVGVDYQEQAVRALVERGIFNNVPCADVTDLARESIDLGRIDYIVAGDTIGHLSNPGELLATDASAGRPGTALVVTTPNAPGTPMFLRLHAGKAIEGTDHVGSFNIITRTNLLRRYGWTTIRAVIRYQDRATSSRWFRMGSAASYRFSGAV